MLLPRPEADSGCTVILDDSSNHVAWARVTRLGEFSTIGRFFWGGADFNYIEKLPPIHVLLFFHGTSYVLILRKKLVGQILGDLFINSSDHPARGQF
jgi:hypothetical protein